MSTTISSTIDIAATRDAVWNVLTDFAGYREWNPIMKHIEGTAREGTKLVVHMSGNDGRGSTFTPKVLAAIPGQELRWLGKLGPGGLFDGEHFFILTTCPSARGEGPTVRCDAVADQPAVLVHPIASPRFALNSPPSPRGC